MWRDISSAPERRPVMTKIDDEHGCRNEQVMTRKGRLWFVENCGVSVYVYYEPTHWREATPTELS